MHFQVPPQKESQVPGNGPGCGLLITDWSSPGLRAVSPAPGLCLLQAQVPPVLREQCSSPALTAFLSCSRTDRGLCGACGTQRTLKPKLNHDSLGSE